MERKRMDPRLLNAFADGELEPEEAARVVMHLADCPEDQAVVDAIMVTNALLVRACAGPIDEPVPPAVRAAIFGEPTAPLIQGARVTPFRRRSRTVWLSVSGGALAAGLAAALVLLPFLGSDAPELALGTIPARSPVAEALTELASGKTRLVANDVELAMVATYPVGDGFCREFTLREDTDAAGLVGLACNEGAGWQVAAREAEPESEVGTSFVPASGEDDDAIRASLDAREAGLVLSADEEAAALAAGWR